MAVNLADLVDRLTGIILEGFVNTAEKHDFDEAKREVKFFLEGNISKLIDWAEANPGKRPPIYYYDGKVAWLNRRQLRTLQRAKVKGRVERASFARSRTR